MARNPVNRQEWLSKNSRYLKGVMMKLNQIPKDVLYEAAKEAFITAVEQTHQDSGNAAWHWTFSGLRAVERSDPRMNFSIKYGLSPIGQKGDKGQNRQAVNSDTIAQGLEMLRRLVYEDGRKAVTLVNLTPYRKKAQIEISANVLTRMVHEAARRAAIKTQYAMSKGYH